MNVNELISQEKKLDSLELLEENRKNGWPDLPAQHKQFCHVYVEEFDHRGAAEACGFPASRGIGLIRESLVSGYVDELLKGLSQNSIIRREWVEVQWLQTYAKLSGLEAVPLITDKGHEFKGKKFHSNEVVATLKELGKMANAYPESQLSGAGGVHVHIDLGALGLDNNANIIEGEVIRKNE